MCMCACVQTRIWSAGRGFVWGGFAHISLWRRYLCGRPRAASVIFRGRDNSKRSTEGRSLDRGLPGGKETCLGGRHGREGGRSGVFLSGLAMLRPPRCRRIRKRRDFFVLSLFAFSVFCLLKNNNLFDLLLFQSLLFFRPLVTAAFRCTAASQQESQLAACTLGGSRSSWGTPPRFENLSSPLGAWSTRRLSRSLVVCTRPL